VSSHSSLSQLLTNIFEPITSSCFLQRRHRWDDVCRWMLDVCVQNAIWES
jgi:hypothetical protein